MLVADSVRLTRESLGEVLVSHGVAAELCSGSPRDVEAAVAAGRCDVVVLNAATVDMKAAAAAVRAGGDLPMIAMSVTRTIDDVAMCAELGLAGFVLADDSVDDLLHLIRTADVQVPQCPPRAVPVLMEALRRRSGVGRKLRLTDRETEIARLLEDGFANKEIASRLGITTRTVKNHLHHIYDKLGVHTRHEATVRLRRDETALSI